MKKDDILKFITFLAVLYGALLVFINKILDLNGMTLTNNTKLFLLVIVVLFIAAFAFIINLKNFEKIKETDWALDKNLSFISIIIIDLFVIIACVGILIVGSLLFPTEKIVTINNRQMIETPPSYFDSRTNYYEYHNRFIKGSEIKFSKNITKSELK